MQDLRAAGARILADPHPLRRITGRLLIDSGLHRRIRLHRPGYLLHFDQSSVCRRIWRDPEFGLADEEMLRTLVRPGDRVVDVGANVGTTALALAVAVGPRGRVTAVEAHPRTVELLRRNVELNRLSQVVVHHSAVAAGTDQIRISDGTADDQNHAVPDGGIPVPAQPLADFLGEPVGLLKVDVEGLEYEVLESAGDRLRNASAIYFEYVAAAYARYGRTLADVVGLLADQGMTTFRIDGTRLVPLPSGYDSGTIENMVALGDDSQRVSPGHLLISAGT